MIEISRKVSTDLGKDSGTLGLLGVTGHLEDELDEADWVDLSVHVAVLVGEASHEDVQNGDGVVRVAQVGRYGVVRESPSGTFHTGKYVT